MRLVLLLKNLLFSVAVPGTVAVFVPALLARGQSTGSAAAVAVSALLFLTGAAIYSWCVWDFATFGRGTPAPIDAPKKLVVRGLYRITRNPMYVGVLATDLGWAVRYLSQELLLYAVGVGCVFHAFVICYEEPRLEDLFGASYTEYRARVGRWLPAAGRRLHGSRKPRNG